MCGKVKAEKFPLAAERVVVEFKLRRAKGCKISKLWLKKKMKEKVEACYGKEAAQKFKASVNWFQRFKKRHNIAFRRRSNKKSLQPVTVRRQFSISTEIKIPQNNKRAK